MTTTTATENLSSQSQDTTVVAESLSVMIQKELTIYTRNGYLDAYEPTIIITSDNRMALVDWCYSVVDHCQFSREAVAAAMDMVDRFLSIPSSTTDEALRDQNKFQLLTITALYVAIKINEREALPSDLFAEISRGAYTTEEIEGMERVLLRGLSWRCNAPTASQVGHSILSLILPHTKCSEVTWVFLMDEMKYLTEHAVRDYYFSTQRPSTIALATIFNAIGHISGHERHELLEAFLCILECFDFDENKIIVAASKRVHRLLQQDNHDHYHDVVIMEEMIEVLIPAAAAASQTNTTEMSSVNSSMKHRLKVFYSRLHQHQQQVDPIQSPKLVSQRSPICIVSICDL